MIALPSVKAAVAMQLYTWFYEYYICITAQSIA